MAGGHGGRSMRLAGHVASASIKALPSKGFRTVPNSAYQELKCVSQWEPIIFSPQQLV